jgi:hypothetical protein
MAAWREGISGAPETAVDVMDNAKRCPHAPSPNNSSRQTYLQRDIREIGTVEFSN